MSGDDELGCLLLCVLERCCDVDLPARLTSLGKRVMEGKSVMSVDAWRIQVLQETTRLRTECSGSGIAAVVEDLKIDIYPSLIADVAVAERRPQVTWRRLLDVLDAVVVAISDPDQQLNRLALSSAVEQFALDPGGMTARQIAYLREPTAATRRTPSRRVRQQALAMSGEFTLQELAEAAGGGARPTLNGVLKRLTAEGRILRTGRSSTNAIRYAVVGIPADAKN